jgi:hypothetical protein
MMAQGRRQTINPQSKAHLSVVNLGGRPRLLFKHLVNAGELQYPHRILKLVYRKKENDKANMRCCSFSLLNTPLISN